MFNKERQHIAKDLFGLTGAVHCPGTDPECHRGECAESVLPLSSNAPSRLVRNGLFILTERTAI